MRLSGTKGGGPRTGVLELPRHKSARAFPNDTPKGANGGWPQNRRSGAAPTPKCQSLPHTGHIKDDPAEAGPNVTGRTV